MCIRDRGIGEDKIGLSARVDVDEGDFSNGRFSIWESGLEVFLQSPLIGVSHRHIADFAAEHLPQTYIVQAGYTTMHNVFVDILAGQGIVGLAIMLAFVVLGIRLLARGLLAYRGDGYCRICLLYTSIPAFAGPFGKACNSMPPTWWFSAQRRTTTRRRASFRIPAT